MPNVPNVPMPVLTALGIGASIAFFMLPALLLAFGIFLTRSGRQVQMLPAVLRLGRLVLGAGGVSLLLMLVGGFSRLPIIEWVSVGLLGLSLVLCGWFLWESQGRPLRAVTWTLFADILVLVAFLPFGIWLANAALNISAYNNLNETEVRAALAKNPSDAAAHSSLAQIDRERGDHAGEVAEYRRVLRVEPDNQDALLLLGGRLTRAGRIDEARPLYQKLAADNGPYVDNARRWLARYGQSGTPLTP